MSVVDYIEYCGNILDLDFFYLEIQLTKFVLRKTNCSAFFLNWYILIIITTHYF